MLLNDLHQSHSLLSSKEKALRVTNDFNLTMKNPSLTLLVAHRKGSVLTVDFQESSLRGIFNPYNNIFFLSIKDSVAYQNMTLALLLASSLIYEKSLLKKPWKARIPVQSFYSFALKNYDIAVCAAYLALPALQPIPPAFTKDQMAAKEKVPVEFYIFREGLEHKKD